MLKIVAQEQSEWSQATFGTDAERGPVGALKHLKLEADEAIANPSDIYEYADCLLLILDASRRAGFDYQKLVEAAYVKLQICKTRKYNRPTSDEPSLHDKAETAKQIRFPITHHPSKPRKQC